MQYSYSGFAGRLHSNDIWFARKEAFAYLQLGQKERAEKILRRIISQKKEWFLLQDLADIVADAKEALCLLATAALAFGDADKKIKLYYSIFNKLKLEPALQDAARQHLLLVASIRYQHEWNIPEAMQKELKEYNAPDLNILRYNDILKQLQPFWNSIANADKTFYNGIIEKILDGNMAGFVKAGDGKRYYFAMKEVNQKNKKAIAGTAVTFELENGFDKKKQLATKNAVRLTIK
jgi:hypothetical protein